MTRATLQVLVSVRADLAAFYRVWLGRIPLTAALADGSVRVDG
jgi:hypothetical protein